MGLIPQWGGFLPPQSPVVGSAVERLSRTQRTLRAITGYGTSSVDVTAGALCSITDFRKDFDDTHITALDFATVTANLITLSRPGYYLVTYHTVLFIDIVEAATVNPSATVGKTILKVDSLELDGTQGFVTAQEIPNLNDFLKWDGTDTGPLTKANISGAPGKTDAFNVVSYALNGGGPQDGPTNITFNGSDQQIITLDTQDPIDCTDNIDAIETASTDSYVKGTTSGTALITVKYNASNVLKIFVGATEYAPTIGVYGSRDFGISDVLALSTSISLIKIF